MKNSTIAVIVIVAGIAGFLGFSGMKEGDVHSASVASAGTMTVYKSPTCGCCVQWAAAMRRAGYEVEVETVDDMETVKSEHGIPHDMQSCHTAVIDGYAVEGHVPAAAIDRLLAERPDIDGIALPGMPSGSPGMPGPKLENWTVYGLRAGTPSRYMTF